MRLAHVFIFITCVFSAAAFADEITPNDNVRNGVVVRAEATTQSARLDLLAPGESLAFIAEQPGWYRVRLGDGRIGYVSKQWTLRIAAEGPTSPSVSAQAPPMFAHFVFVGQGAGAILEFPCGVAIIDTGGQFGSRRTYGDRLFRDYLARFFAARPHLNNTIDVLFTTHAHADHLNGLPLLIGADETPIYDIRNVVDNGQSGNSGSAAKQTRFRAAVLADGGAYSAVSITQAFDEAGLTNAVIDPIDCEAAGVDPEFTLYWGSWARSTIQALGGRGTGQSNPNNHSLVIRVDYGQASFLFTGDLEAGAIGDMLALYADNLAAFDIDVYVVGHHGSPNATSEDMLAAMSPELAIISAGDPSESGNSTARDHGHPRIEALDMLQHGRGAVSRRRDEPVNIAAFEAADVDAVEYTIARAIYATSWEGDVVISATTSGDYVLIDD